MTIEFDDYAARYLDALQSGLDATGESFDYFARGRIRWLASCLAREGESPRRVLDFGCGIGEATCLLTEYMPDSKVVGVDLSRASISHARQRHADAGIQFETCEDLSRLGSFDLIYCNGVFHHIAPPDRPKVLAQIAHLLSSTGWFAFWENNPWNPGTRYVMRRIPFDRDAVLLSAPSARRMLAAAGYQPVSTHYMFIFPRFLSALRRAEPWLVRLPLGGQYQILCRRRS